MHRDDALRKACSAPANAHRPAVELDRSRVRRVHAGDDLGERRFAGAVLADQAANATRRDREIDAAKRADRAETARQPAAPQQDGALSPQPRSLLVMAAFAARPGASFARRPEFGEKASPDDAVTCR